MQVLTHLVFYRIILVCVCSVYFLVFPTPIRGIIFLSRGITSKTGYNSTSFHCHLGITFQSSATWKKHIDDIYKKACSRLLLLRQVKHLLDRYSLIRIYFAFIRPVLEYGDVVW
jgi:hypothetical protein